MGTWNEIPLVVSIINYKEEIVKNYNLCYEPGMYMDRRCVYYHKPLLESGTLGTKGNVQVFETKEV